MAVVNLKSAAITNRDATPRVLNNGRLQGAPVLNSCGLVTVTNGDSVGSTYRISSIPSNALVLSVKVSCPDIGTTTAGDLGIYRTTADGGAVVDADFFGSAVSLSGGALNKSEVINESGVQAVADMEQPLWQALGLTVDPNLVYDIVLTLTGAADASGAVFVETEYTV